MSDIGIALLPQYAPERFRDLAARIETLGYGRLWIPDERFYRELAVSMTQAAMATSTVTIGSAVTDPFIRHPALTAQMMASLDEISGGRIIVGMGSGLAGFAALGLTPRRPVQSIQEAVEIMRALWTGSTVDYHGDVFTFNESQLDFTPHRSRIPVYIAGRGPKVLQLAGRIADGVIVGSLAARAALTYALDQIDSGLAAARRRRSDLELVMWLHTAISSDGDLARDAVRPIVANVLSSSRTVLDDLGVEISPHIRDVVDTIEHNLASPEMARFADMLDGETLGLFSVAGTPDEVASQISRLRRSGVDHLALVPWLAPGQRLEEFLEACAPLVDISR